MRHPKPFFRKQTESYYLRLGKQFIPLGKDKEAAWDEYHAIMGKRAKGQMQAEGSVAKILDLYWQWCNKNLAPTTAHRRKPFLKGFGLHLGAKFSVRRLRPFHVQEWVEKAYPNASATYRHTIITIIKAALSWALKMGYIGHDPIAKMAKPTPRVRQEFVPSDLWPQVLAAATDEPFRDLLTVMLTSGARPQEIFKAEASHFEPAQGRLVFPMEQSKGKKRSRVVWLPDEAREIIARLVKQYPKGKLFRNSRGKPWDRNSINCRFRRLKTVLKMPWLTATTLRHSFAHHRLTSGQDSHVVSKLMGHVDGRMIETRYGHVDQNPEFMRQQANRIANPTQPAAPTPLDTAPSQAG